MGHTVRWLQNEGGDGSGVSNSDRVMSGLSAWKMRGSLGLLLGFLQVMQVLE